MKIERKPLSDLIPAGYNPRVDLRPGDAAYEKLKRSMQEFGCVEPIVWNRRSGHVVGGHQRLKVLQDLDFVEIDCVVVDLDDSAERALNLALNKISGDWDTDKLREAMMAFEQEFDMTLTGFDADEIQSMRDIMLPATDDGFDAEAAYDEIEAPATQYGDVWQLGEHRLLCGDCTNYNDMLRLMDGEQAQLVVTDPPYNVNYHSKAGSIQNDNMKTGDFAAFLYDSFRAARSCCEAGAAAYVFHADSNGEVFRQQFRAAGWELRQVLAWVKNHFALGRTHYHYQHEPVLYGHLPGGSTYFTGDRTQHTVLELLREDLAKMKKAQLIELLEQYRAAEDAALTTVLRADKPLRSDEHPTMKPIPLLGQLIKNSSKPGWIVLDTFGGSGSTLIACEQLGRRARLMEIDPKYCDVIVRRWESMTGQTAERVSAE